jgi:hypothetical protein
MKLYAIENNQWNCARDKGREEPYLASRIVCDDKCEIRRIQSILWPWLNGPRKSAPKNGYIIHHLHTYTCTYLSSEIALLRRRIIIEGDDSAAAEEQGREAGGGVILIRRQHGRNSSTAGGSARRPRRETLERIPFGYGHGCGHWFTYTFCVFARTMWFPYWCVIFLLSCDYGHWCGQLLPWLICDLCGRLLPWLIIEVFCFLSRYGICDLIPIVFC